MESTYEVMKNKFEVREPKKGYEPSRAEPSRAEPSRAKTFTF